MNTKTVFTFKHLTANNDHRTFRCVQLFTEGMGAVHKLFQDISGVPKMIVAVCEVPLTTDNGDIKFVVYPRLPYSCVEQRCFKSWVGSNQHNKVSILYSNNTCVQ